MSRFSFKDYIFNNLIPFFYKQNDTYKNSQGKGILERFMEVCSEYFDTDIIEDQDDIPGLDNILNLIDVDLTPELYLNYIWEFLGEIPYGFGVIIQGSKEKGYNIISPTDYLDIDRRRLLKYAISLYKIRGTNRFYEVLGKFYGVEFELIETQDGGDPGDEEAEPNHDHLVLATYEGASGNTIATYPLSGLEIRAPFPDGDCYSCLYFLLRIGMSTATYNRLVQQGKLNDVKLILKGIIEKYLPIHCRIANYDSGNPKIVIYTT